MPPKSKKTTAAGPSRKPKSTIQSEAIKPTFVNAEAENRYKNSIVGRKCIQERGFIHALKSIQVRIQERHWEEFVKQPDAALVPVVREFYANAKQHDNLKTLVRGKWVPFDSHTINRRYKLPDIPEDDYSKLMEEGPDYEEVIQFLARAGTQWKTSKNVVLRFPANGLHLEGKVWHYFISAKLMPSYHVSGVSRERAVLNYAIQKGLSIDVGKLIQASILNTAKAARVGFGHPSLIYDLCLQAGVWTSPAEEIQHPKPAITPDLIRKWEKDGTSSDDDDDPSQPIPKATKDQPSTSQQRKGKQPESEQAEISKLREEISEVKQMASSINRRLDQFFARQEQQFDYLMQVYRGTASQAGNPAPFPPPPEFTHISPAYAPETIEEEEEDTESEESF